MIQIHCATIDEVEDLQDLNDELFTDNYKYDKDLNMKWAQSKIGRNYFRKLIGSKKSACFIAEDNGKKVGYIAIAPKPMSYRKSKYAEIENMGVSPEYQSKGIGSQLMQEALKWAKAKGFQKAYVNSYFHNTGAIAFYKKNGFLETDICLERTI